MAPQIDPDEHTVPELRAAIDDVDDPEALAAILSAERAGDDRTTAVEAIEDRLRAVDAQPAAKHADGPVESAAAEASAELGVIPTLREALLYPWAGGSAGVTLVLGGILTLLSPLVIPGVIVLGYGLRVVDAVLEGREGPPPFEDWGALFGSGLKATIILLGYIALPLTVGAALVSTVAAAFGIRLNGPVPTFAGAGGIAFLLVISLAGLALVVWYLAPAALVHVGRTRRLPAALDRDDVWRLATADAYGSAWLLALAVFAAAAVVLAVLYAATIGVIVSGFVTFYAFVAMAYLFAQGAEAAGFDREVPGEGGDVDA